MTAATEGAPLAVPEGTRLVHIGPPGAGTLLLQDAFRAAIAAVSAQGVRYAAAERRRRASLEAILDRKPFGRRPASPWLVDWTPLLADVRRSRAPRVVISRGLLADARPDDIRHVVADLDPARVHVAVTLEPLGRILPAQWQQDVMDGERRSFEEWLAALLRAQPGPNGHRSWHRFWHRFRHDRLVARWGAVVGRERVTAVVVDEHRPDHTLRAFERLTGLHDRTLAGPAEPGSRLLTLPEIETLRAFNAACSVEGIDRPVRRRVVLDGAARELRRSAPPEDVPPIEMPPWAADQAVAIAREIVFGIQASGIRVVGDLEALAERPARGPDVDRPTPVIVSPAVSASVAMGVLLSSGLAGGRRDLPDGPRPVPSAPAVRPEPIELARLSTRDLIAILVRRGTAVATSTVRTARGRLRPRRPVS